MKLDKAHGRTTSIAIGLGTLLAATASLAEEMPRPPFVMTDVDYILIGLNFDEAAVRERLPEGIEPVEGAPGGVAIYNARGGYGLSPYTSTYVYVDVEGHDSPEGAKGRWMLKGFYGPDPAPAVLTESYGWPVSLGRSWHENIGDVWNAATVDESGEAIVAARIRRTEDPCQTMSGLTNYPSDRAPGDLVVVRIPWTGDICGAEPESVEFKGGLADALQELKPSEPSWAILIQDLNFSFTQPVPLEQ